MREIISYVAAITKHTKKSKNKYSYTRKDKRNQVI